MPSSVLAELDALGDRGRVAIAPALALAARHRPLRNAGTGDDALVALLDESGGLLLTADRELAGRLRRRGHDVLVPRDRRRLERLAGHRPSGNR